MTYNIPMAKPDLTNLEIEYATKALKENEIGVKSYYVWEFEERLQGITGYKYALFTNSGWSALLLACRVMREKFDEITMPSFTMIASGTAAKEAGLKIKLVDVNERGLMERKYYIKMIMTVDMYGKECEARGDFIIQDAAEIFGKQYLYGDIVCFSFFYNKILTTGNGGAVLTNDKELYDEMKLFRHHYYDGSSYVHDKAGYNVSQTGVMAAIGTKQLERADEILEKRRALGERYVKELGAWECDEYWYQPLIVKDKEGLKKHLAENDIASRDFFNPLHKQPPLKQDGHFPNSEKLYKTGILLPLYSTMEKSEQDYVIEKVNQWIKNKG